MEKHFTNGRMVINFATCHQSFARAVHQWKFGEIQSVDVHKHWHIDGVAHIDVKLTAKSANRQTIIRGPIEKFSIQSNRIASHCNRHGCACACACAFTAFVCKSVLIPSFHPSIIHKLRNYNAQWPLHFTSLCLFLSLCECVRCMYRSRQYRFEKQWELIAKSKWTYNIQRTK